MKIFRNTKIRTPLAPQQDEDEFRTAPNSPSFNGENSFIPDPCNAQNSDDVSLPDPAYNSKKRRYIDSMRAPEPRKASRNIVESHTADYIGVNEVRSCHDVMKLETLH